MSNYSLHIEYDGDHYVVLQNEGRSGLTQYREYAIGELACELTRLDLLPVKEIILQAEGIREKLDIDVRDEAVDHYYKVRDRILHQIREQYPPMLAGLLSGELIKAEDGFIDVPGDCREEWSDWEGYHLWDDRPVIEEILDGSGYEQFGAETIGQFLLTNLAVIHQHFRSFMSSFLHYAGNQENPITFEKYSTLRELFEGRGSQDIQYNVRFYDEGLHAVYIIDTFSDLMVFEYLNMTQRGIRTKKCRNCGNFFVPGKRSDAIYCDYPSPSNPQKTCKEVGAQITRSNKERSDVATREYRKTYLWLKNTIKRHPENKDAKIKLEILTARIKEWRDALETGDVGTDAFLKWLKTIRE